MIRVYFPLLKRKHPAQVGGSCTVKAKPCLSRRTCARLLQESTARGVRDGQRAAQFQPPPASELSNFAITEDPTLNIVVNGWGVPLQFLNE